jgi:hypothetical protein
MTGTAAELLESYYESSTTTRCYRELTSWTGSYRTLLDYEQFLVIDADVQPCESNTGSNRCYSFSLSKHCIRLRSTVPHIHQETTQLPSKNHRKGPLAWN